ncbi:hypothetical protein OS493_036649 [Desmophyllum pertusum]|uniref:Ig-like domain-containing protein n=1 Tax=Desmophyllum pertusum TaxID=174260 RepID=A0A9W9YUN6_9CNID|nr:hypothetical protein OS493_036649 [Desmophyllum pertusum]
MGARPSIYYVDPATEVGTEKSLTLTCHAHGLPNPTFTWITPDGHNVNATTPFPDINYNENIRGKKLQQDGSLLIFNTRVEYQGSYTCVASNVMGKDEKKVNVTVREDLVEVDAAITIEDEIFDEDLENKASERYQQMEEQVKPETRAAHLQDWPISAGKPIPAQRICTTIHWTGGETVLIRTKKQIVR